MSNETTSTSAAEDPTAEPGAVVVLHNPMPLDVSGTLMRLISARWPNGRILTPEHPQYPADAAGHMVLWVPDSDRFAHDNPPAIADVLAEPLPERVLDPAGENLEGVLTSLSGADISMEAPEWVARFFCGLFRQSFEDTGASNYLQMGLRDDVTGGRWQVTVRAPDGDAPATKAAQLEADLALARAALLCALDGAAPQQVPDVLRDVVDEALDGDWGSIEELLEAHRSATERAAALRAEDRS